MARAPSGLAMTADLGPAPIAMLVGDQDRKGQADQAEVGGGDHPPAASPMITA